MFQPASSSELAFFFAASELLDNLTHALAGAAIGQAGLKRLSGLGMAALILGANIPDIDGFAAFFGTHTLSARRGWTHGPIALVVLPVVLTAALVAWDRVQGRRQTRPPDRAVVQPRQLLLLAFIGCLTHPLLDWMNTYGVRLLMPFSDRWFYGDVLQIIDPWIWIALGLGVFVTRRRLRRAGAAPERPARLALVLVAGYIVVMFAGSRHASDVARRQAIAEGIRPARVMAGPVFFNPARRRIIIDDGEAYTFGDVRWTPGTTVQLDTTPLPRNDRHPLAVAALADADVRRFLYWSRFPYFVLPASPADDGELELLDARFGGDRPVRNPFRVTVSVRELQGRD